MPLYEYACPVCSTTFDCLRPYSRMDDEAPCPECGSESERQLSVFASFSAGSDGETHAIAGGGVGCGATSCGTCRACSVGA